MANLRLKDNGNIIDFDSTPGFREPDILEKLSFRSLDGSLYEYKLFHKRTWEVPVDFFNATDTTQLFTWWVNRTSVKFYPDYASNPGTYYNVKIMNKNRPLAGFSGTNWRIYWGGTLVLEEV